MKFRRIISLALSLCLVLGLLQISCLGAFADDEILTSADGLWNYRVLNDGTAEIYNEEFATAYLGNQAYVTIPDTIDGYTVTSIGDFAFFANEYAVSVTIGDNITNIGLYAFVMCYFLESINVDSNNAYYLSDDGVLFDIDRTCLYNYPCAKADSDYEVPDGVEVIMPAAFGMAANLETLVIPDSVVDIEGDAFTMCAMLSSVVLSENLTAIPDSSFYGCESLLELTIPRSVTYIDRYAFDDSGLTTINGYYGTAAEEYANEYGYTFVSLDVVIPGDIDGSGDVNISDYAMLKLYVSGEDMQLTAFQFNCADFNSDGVIDAFDLYYADKLINSLV